MDYGCSADCKSAPYRVAWFDSRAADMDEYKIKANEDFFLQVIALLKDGGAWMWPAEMQLFKKVDGKLCSNQDAYDAVSEIVSEPFLMEHFRVIL